MGFGALEGGRYVDHAASLPAVAEEVGCAASGGGNGLRGARERIEAAGGRLQLRSDGGTTLEVVL